MTRLLALATLLLPLAFPQQRPAAPPLADAKPDLLPGLALAVEVGGVHDVRQVRVASLAVPSGTPASSMLPAGPFKASFDGFVSVDLGTDVAFSVEGNGSVKVTVAGKTALEAAGDDLSKAPEAASLRLRKGRNALKVAWTPPAIGDAVLRLFWASTDFAREPIPPQALSHDANASAVQEGRRVREGRELAASRRCVKCHLHEAKGMPEMEMDGPSLADAGARLTPEWMARWIEHPRSHRPEATMPRLPGIGPAEAADLAAYLATLGSPTPDGPAPTVAAVAAGGVLFAEMRCIGCHTLPDKPPAPDRIPLSQVAGKWRAAALRAFLRAPQKHFAWIEMPDFRMTEDEAAKLAAFVRSRPVPPVEPPTAKGDVARGKTLAETRGCLSCHAIAGTNAYQAEPLAALAHWTEGCLAKAPAGQSPDLGLTDGQREALRAFAATDLTSLSREALPEFAERQVKALRCFACHKRDDRVDAWSDVAGEAREFAAKKQEDPNSEFAEVAPAEPWFPSLTWTGDKLKPEWAVAFVRGDAIERPRPYLGALRMPAFPGRAERMVHGFALEHGRSTTPEPAPAPDREMSELGRKLAGPSGGLDCLACHGIGPKGATKVFEAPAPNFKFTRARIRKDFYHRWVREPLRIEPGTKMPQFIKEGRTQLTEILDGDGLQQAEALWHYLLEGEKIRPPGE